MEPFCILTKLFIMRIFNNILRESFSDLNENMPENFIAFAVSVDKLLPSGGEVELNEGSLSFTVSF